MIDTYMLRTFFFFMNLILYMVQKPPSSSLLFLSPHSQGTTPAQKVSEQSKGARKPCSWQLLQLSPRKPLKFPPQHSTFNHTWTQTQLVVDMSSPLVYSLKNLLALVLRFKFSSFILWDKRTQPKSILLNIPVVILFQFDLIWLTMSVEKLMGEQKTY